MRLRPAIRAKISLASRSGAASRAGRSRKRLRSKGQDGFQIIPPGDTLASVFLAQAGRGPDRVVLADQTSGIKTFRAVITGILALKPQLERLPGGYVGIMLPASAGGGVLYLATLFAGKIPVMVNWTVGVRNMTHSLDLLGVKAVLTSGRVVQKIESQTGTLGELKSRFVLMEDLGRSVGTGAKLSAWLGARFGWRRAFRRSTTSGSSGESRRYLCWARARPTTGR